MSSLKTVSVGHLERPTRNTELEGCLKRLNWKASLKGCLKRPNLKSGLKDINEGLVLTIFFLHIFELLERSIKCI